MEKNQLWEFEDDLAAVQSEYSQEQVIAKYPQLNHPHYYYRIAESYYLRFNNYQKAKPYTKKAIEFGFKSNNPFNQTAFADSIGQCMLMYLKNESSLNFTEQFKISCLCYAYFSQIIDRYSTKAFNSYFSRGILIDYYASNKNKGMKKMLADYYYDGPDLCIQMLTYGDFMQAAIGFKIANELLDAQRASRYANENLALMKSLPQYSNLDDLSEIEIMDISLENSNYMSKKLLQDFQNGHFDML